MIEAAALLAAGVALAPPGGLIGTGGGNLAVGLLANAACVASRIAA